MSKETLEWLNENTLIGFTDARGRAWHYREGSDNHYPGAIPVGDVQRRLFHWSPVEAEIFVRSNDSDNDNALIAVPGRKAIMRSDTDDVLGIFTDNYQPHNYHEWLVGAVSNILGDSLAIGSAGLLKRGAVAWVQVEVPESIQTPEGVEFRPNLLATTSLDGSVATTYKRTVTNVVCDNTLAAGLWSDGEVFRVKHTRNSMLRITEAREALAVVQNTAEEFQDEVKTLVETAVTDKQWSEFLDALTPVPSDPGRAKTLAEHKRENLTGLWNNDNRVAPWHGTAWGVLAATNTYQHHISTVRRNAHRAERNMENVIKGKTEQSDQQTLEALGKVLAAA